MRGIVFYSSTIYQIYISPFEILRNSASNLRFPSLTYVYVRSRPKMRVHLVLLAFEKGDGRAESLRATSG